MRSSRPRFPGTFAWARRRALKPVHAYDPLSRAVAYTNLALELLQRMGAESRTRTPTPTTAMNNVIKMQAS